MSQYYTDMIVQTSGVGNSTKSQTCRDHQAADILMTYSTSADRRDMYKSHGFHAAWSQMVCGLMLVCGSVKPSKSKPVIKLSLLLL